MALIKCSECGKEISDKASACPHCGCPVIVDSKKQEYENLYANAKSFSKVNNAKDLKNGYSSTGRLIVGIIFIVFSAMVLFQSCAAGMVNALEGGNGSDGLIGTFTGYHYCQRRRLPLHCDQCPCGGKCLHAVGEFCGQFRL